MPDMPNYRVYFMNNGDHIVAAMDIRAATDDDAIAQGAELCKTTPECAAIEVWHHTRLVYRHDKAAA